MPQLSKQQHLKTSFPNHLTCWAGVKKHNVVSDPPRRLPGTWLSLPPATHPPPTPPCSGISESSSEPWIEAEDWQLAPVPGCHQPPVSHSSRTGAYLRVFLFPPRLPSSPPQFSLGLAVHGSPCNASTLHLCFVPSWSNDSMSPSTKLFLSLGQAFRSVAACGLRSWEPVSRFSIHVS